MLTIGLTIVSVIIGEFLWFLLVKMFSKDKHVSYTIDTSAQLEGESTDAFIKRILTEDLGTYIIE